MVLPIEYYLWNVFFFNEISIFIFYVSYVKYFTLYKILIFFTFPLIHRSIYYLVLTFIKLQDVEF